MQAGIDVGPDLLKGRYEKVMAKDIVHAELILSPGKSWVQGLSQPASRLPASQPAGGRDSGHGQAVRGTHTRVAALRSSNS